MGKAPGRLGNDPAGRKRVAPAQRKDPARIRKGLPANRRTLPTFRSVLAGARHGFPEGRNVFPGAWHALPREPEGPVSQERSRAGCARHSLRRRASCAPRWRAQPALRCSGGRLRDAEVVPRLNPRFQTPFGNAFVGGNSVARGGSVLRVAQRAPRLQNAPVVRIRDSLLGALPNGVWERGWKRSR
jgi:hypothetical protein